MYTKCVLVCFALYVCVCMYTRVVMMPNNFSFSIRFLFYYMVWFWLCFTLCPFVLFVSSKSSRVWSSLFFFHSLSFNTHTNTPSIKLTMTKKYTWLECICNNFSTLHYLIAVCNKRHATWHIISKNAQTTVSSAFSQCGSIKIIIRCGIIMQQYVER